MTKYMDKKTISYHSPNNSIPYDPQSQAKPANSNSLEEEMNPNFRRRRD
jgi:hypothetical protein